MQHKHISIMQHKSITYLIVLCLSFTTLWSCGSDSGNDGGSGKPSTSPKPNWTMNSQGTDDAPVWTVGNVENYELTMSLGVKLNPVLAQFAGTGDMIASFIGGECRSVTAPSLHNVGTLVPFVSAGLNIMGNGNDGHITFKYYCSRLHHIFVLNNYMDFNPNQSPSQAGATYELPFETQDGLLSVQYTLTLPEGTELNLADGDEIAALTADGKCRSVTSWGSRTTAVINVLASQGGRLNIMFYDNSEHILYQAAETVTLTDSNPKSLTITKFTPSKV